MTLRPNHPRNTPPTTEGRTMIDDVMLEAEDKMDKALEAAKHELAAIRTGRANPAMFTPILVDYYAHPAPAAGLDHHPRGPNRHRQPLRPLRDEGDHHRDPRVRPRGQPHR